jgi:hypothetical protein
MSAACRKPDHGLASAQVRLAPNSEVATAGSIGRVIFLVVYRPSKCTETVYEYAYGMAILGFVVHIVHERVRHLM